VLTRDLKHFMLVTFMMHFLPTKAKINVSFDQTPWAEVATCENPLCICSSSSNNSSSTVVVVATLANACSVANSLMGF